MTPETPNIDQNNGLETKISPSVRREAPEPIEKRGPVPFWLILGAGIVIFWGGIHLALNSGGFRADVYNPDLVSWTGGGAGVSSGAPVDPKVIGKRVFAQNCVICHQASGMGVAGQFPPLVGSEWVVGGDWVGDNHLVKVLLKGMQGPVTVKGGNYNNAMPPWSQLKDEQIAAVLTYIRSEWGNKAEPITEEYVKTVRDSCADRTEPWTQKDLKAIPAEKCPPGGAVSAPVPAKATGA